MDWRNHIHVDPDVMVGKPVIKGTRLTVEFLMRLFASGWSVQQVLESYPHLTKEQLQSVFAYAAEVLEDERVYAHPQKRT